MNTITTTNNLATVRDNITRAQRLVLATEGRTLDFETADEINRALFTSIQVLTPLADDEPELSDDEIIEFESRLSRDHDDAAYWQGGCNV